MQATVSLERDDLPSPMPDHENAPEEADLLSGAIHFSIPS
jgi:hypothetical protein